MWIYFSFKWFVFELLSRCEAEPIVSNTEVTKKLKKLEAAFV